MGDIERIQKIAPSVAPPSATGRVHPADQPRDGHPHHQPPQEDLVELHEEEGGQAPEAPAARVEPDEHLDIAV
ncbi:MAG: hypothetical protein HYR64_05405 [Fimbriimonas ginsengisoli]|uniref:Uncharacterized protein n=1 Tax=Fimbriimonas ginsengisoli TaxID=1005039 RepID=A0A931PWD1_FIMGI|nr:hypothetical protein [Fimbriimonas ginsengisoli]